MKSRKLILGMFIALLLGQSVMASADIHVFFEDSGIAHASDMQTSNADLSSTDDCGHCCHSHGSGVGLFSQLTSLSELSASLLNSQYSNTYLSPPVDSALRPPRA